MRFLLFLLLTTFLASSAQATFIGPGSQNSGSTVQSVKNMPDDARITLTGNIVAQIGKEKYIFKDKTGEITVEIDDKHFYGRDVTPANTVRIMGEVDKDFGKPTEIDVKSLEVLR